MKRKFISVVLAATIATLAWFGGGSLAAGGAGMDGGAAEGIRRLTKSYTISKKRTPKLQT